MRRFLALLLCAFLSIFTVARAMKPAQAFVPDTDVKASTDNANTEEETPSGDDESTPSASNDDGEDANDDGGVDAGSDEGTAPDDADDGEGDDDGNGDQGG